MNKAFFHVWSLTYFQPQKAFQSLSTQPAPLFGIYSIILRSLIISLLWMLPRAVMKLEPLSVPPLSFLTVKNYYWHAMWIYPAFEFSRWLFFSALIHLGLIICGQKSNYDAILNINGIVSITIEPAVRIWDWIIFLCGWNGNLMFLGMSHALLAWPWSLALLAMGLWQMSGIPPKWSVPICFLSFLIFIPFAALFLRP